MKRCLAELIGTFWLVFGGCGSALLAAGVEPGGIGLLGVSFAFGLTVLTMAYAVGHISGGHFNPAVSFGLWAGGRFAGRDLPGYIISQVIGGLLAGALLYFIVTGQQGFSELGRFASNGFGEASPGHYSMGACLAAEFVLTAVFIFVIMGATDSNAPQGFAPLAIGLALTLIHLISIPLTNTSVNPARSMGVSVFAGGIYLQQLWFFWVVPIAGGIIGGVLYRFLGCCKCCKKD